MGTSCAVIQTTHTGERVTGNAKVAGRSEYPAMTVRFRTVDYRQDISEFRKIPSNLLPIPFPEFQLIVPL